MLQSATRLTVENYPFLYCLDRKAYPQINNAILNSVSERFAIWHMQQETGLPVPMCVRTYHFALTCERGPWVAQVRPPRHSPRLRVAPGENDSRGSC